MIRFVIQIIFILAIYSCRSDSSTKTDNNNKVHIYSAKFIADAEWIYDEFEKKTGIKVLLTYDKGERLIQKIIAEGRACEADILICQDAGQMTYAANTNLLERVETEPLDEHVPLSCRHEDRKWFGLCKRAKVLLYNKEIVNSTMLNSYLDLSTAKWVGQINISSSSEISNRSLLASIIANCGEEKAEVWSKGIGKNLSGDSEGTDSEQIEMVFSGQGNVAIVGLNSIGEFMKKHPEKSKKTGIFFPDQKTTGTHINFVGAGLLSESKNKKNALKLLEFLTSEGIQTYLSEKHFEYPVHPNVELPEFIQRAGPFNSDALDFNFLQSNKGKASEILGVSGW
jgi:iron(III) transport system substrate-binding protein